MHKKEVFKNLASKYNIHLYTGLYGYVMRYCHRQLECFKRKEKYDNILEIGAGIAPHINYIKHKFDKYYIAETSEVSVKYYENDKNINAVLYDGAKLPFENNFFDRIIISHVLEHVNDPEKFIIQAFGKLRKNLFPPVLLINSEQSRLFLTKGNAQASSSS